MRNKAFILLAAAACMVLFGCPPKSETAGGGGAGTSGGDILVGEYGSLTGAQATFGNSTHNGIMMAADEINAAGGIQGRKIKMILEDNGYDPKKAVLASQKMVERDKVFAMVGPMGSPTVLAAQDVLFDAGVLQLFPLTAAEFTFKFDPSKPQERLKFNNLLPYVESTRAALKYMMDTKNFKKPCIMHQDDEYGKNVLDGFNQQLAAMN